MGLGLFAPSIFTYTTVFFSFFLIYICVKYSRKSLNYFKSIKDINFKISFAVVGVFYLVLYFLFFPGLMGYDDVNMSKTVMNGRAWEWQSLSYSLLSGAGIMLFGKLGFLPLLAIAYYLYLSVKMLAFADTFKTAVIYKQLAAVLFIVISLHPFMQGMLLTYTRDILYSLMLVHLCMIVYFKDDWKNSDLIWLSIFLVFFADLRQESLVYLVLVPFILGFSKILNFKQLRSYVLYTLAAVFVYFFIAPKVYQTQSYNHNYQVTTYVHPLSYVLSNNGRQPYSPQDLEDIDRVFDVEKLIKDYTPLDIGPFHSGGFRDHSSEEDWKKFKIAARNVLLQSKEQVLESRIMLFMCTLNICQHSGMAPFSDYMRDAPDQSEEMLKMMGESSSKYVIEGNLKRYFNLIQDFYSWTGFWRIINTLAIPLIFIFIGLVMFNRRPNFFRAAVIVAVRLPILFLLAPASYYKYIFSVQVFFAIFAPLLLLAFIDSKSQPNLDSVK